MRDLEVRIVFKSSPGAFGEAPEAMTADHERAYPVIPDYEQVRGFLEDSLEQFYRSMGETEVK